MTRRHDNDGLRKRCDCSRRAWPKCSHPWHFNFKPRGGTTHYRFPLDRYAERPIATKDDAEAERDRLRTLIRTGQFPPAPTTPVVAATAGEITFAQFTTLWCERARADKSKTQRATDKGNCRRLAALALDGEQVGDVPIGRLTESDFEVMFSQLRTTLAAATQNKYRQTMLTLQKWGLKKGYLTRRWVSEEATEKNGTLEHRKGASRYRRLVADELDEHGQITTPGEEQRLLAHASPWLQRLIIAALESCCRRGELLSLLWSDVDWQRGKLRIRAENAKSGESRGIPISPTLRAVLDMIRHDPAGRLQPPGAHVFGDAIGRRVSSPKKAWETLVLKAHGYMPEWNGSTLSAASRAQYKAINLHFHDLRHEGASRLLEQGWPLHHVQGMLGHAEASTTSIYLNTTTHQLHDSMRRFAGPARPLPLRAVAQTPVVEHRPPCNDDTTGTQHAVVN
jgi:integrase